MALTKAKIDLMYLEVLARHATVAEQDAFSALSNDFPSVQIERDIITLPEATILVDPLIRLYQGAFGRLPDTIDPNGNFDIAGQSGYWVNVNAARSGIGLLGLARAFVVSSEFKDLYGTIEVTPALITAFYQHILDRAPSSAEVAAWVATRLDAASLLLGFTQSVEFIARSQVSVDQFKFDLSNGLHPSGPLLPPPPEFTLESDVAVVDEGSSVIFTLQGPQAAAGQTLSYVIAGLTETDVVGGQLSGTVTLGPDGTAFLRIKLAGDRLTEGPEAFNIRFPGIARLDLNVAVNDTSVTSLNFTSAIGETIEGSIANDTFVATVDRSITNNSSTYTNLIDVAQGKGGFDTVQLLVNRSDVTILPNSDVEELKVTDLSGETYNLFRMPNIEIISSVGSTGDMKFFNVQNIVDLSVSNSDVGGEDISVTVVDAAGTANVNVSLNNSGAFDLDYFNTSGDSVVENWAFQSSGNNHIDDLEGAEITQTITVNGDGTFHLDFNNGEDTRSVTLVDASAFDGDFLLHNLEGGASLEVLGAVGDNDIEIDEVDTGANVKVVTQNGSDVVDFDLDGNNGATIVVETGNGGDFVQSLDGDNSDTTAFTITMGTGVNDVDMDIGANSTVTISSTGPTEIDIDAFNTADAGPSGALTAEIVVGNGANDVRVNSNANAGQDNGSNIRITAGNGGNVINTVSNNAAVVAILAGTGGDTITAAVNDGNSKVTVDAGEGNNDVTVAGDEGAEISITTGGGSDTIFANGLFDGGNGAASITVNSGGGNDHISANWGNFDAPVVNLDLGKGDDRLQLGTFQFVTKNAVLDGGDGFDTFAMDESAFIVANLDGTVKNFEAVEVLNELTNDLNAIEFGPLNHISRVILDQGIGQDVTISGLNANPTIEIKGDAGAGGDDLTVLINNANINTKDNVSIILNANQAGTVEFGGLSTPGVETMSIHSTSQQVVKAGIVNNLELNNDLTTLTVTGDVTLDLNDQQFSVQTLNAQTFTGGLTLDDDFTGAVTINAGLTAGTNNINIDNNANNSVTLGNGNSTVITFGGHDVINLGSGVNTVHGGDGQDDITVTLDGNVDTFIYDQASEFEFLAARYHHRIQRQ